ncbi:hypothetical protein Mgra_00009615 [Meloidogyne graminicola]|uniref:Uncharacterized protein n=1 Tax=Meloidogyne graminicola TaxID=189291 RepID=A0A8S9ZC02_9BILA|nr:hypothetical protein Mgra_00009615 [Meloidogyne graminicola]
MSGTLCFISLFCKIFITPVFKYVENKWKYIDPDLTCCVNKCVNTNNPNGFCTKGNGYIQIKSNTEIEYINCMEDVKLIFEENEEIWIGLRNDENKIFFKFII